MAKSSSTRSFERIAKTGGALLAVIAGVRIIKTSIMKEIDIKNQYKGLALPVAAYFASDFLPLDPDLKFGVQLGAGVSLLSGALDAMGMSKTKDQIGLAGDSTDYQFRNLSEVMDFAKSQLPAPQVMNGQYIETQTQTREAIPDGREVGGSYDFETNGYEDYGMGGAPEQNW